MTKIKICGIRTVEDALFAVQAGADGIGFVFAQSSRRVDVDTARRISASLPPFVSRVGVFVDAQQELVEQVLRYAGLTSLQFHGGEDAAYCRSFSLPVIKAIKVCSKADLSMVSKYSVAAILLDTYDPQLAGGTGRTFDWSLAANETGKPLVLAGGLNAGNVADAVRQVRPYAVDVSSGVETDGIKDKTKIREFIAAVRRCA